jgi:hypothetical protein
MGKRKRIFTLKLGNQLFYTIFERNELNDMKSIPIIKADLKATEKDIRERVNNSQTDAGGLILWGEMIHSINKMLHNIQILEFSENVVKEYFNTEK